MTLARCCVNIERHVSAAGVDTCPWRTTVSSASHIKIDDASQVQHILQKMHAHPSCLVQLDALPEDDEEQEADHTNNRHPAE